jgi:two-component system, sensor histidine kinase RegB
VSDGRCLAVPRLFEFGFWLSIVIGILFLGLYSRRVADRDPLDEPDALMATQMALAREQKLTDLGGVVAAAAHELGTPLATIKLVSAELIEELADRPDLRDDAELIRDQADRCRDILRSMGRAGKDDLHLRQAPLGRAARGGRAAPEPRQGVDLSKSPPARGRPDRQPAVLRRPEVIHGLRNLIQNAVDFAHLDGLGRRPTGRATGRRCASSTTARAIRRSFWAGSATLPAQRRGARPGAAPGYEGMGLGLFIAKTLLERSGAELSFANASDPFPARPARTGGPARIPV